MNRWKGLAVAGVMGAGAVGVVTLFTPPHAVRDPLYVGDITGDGKEDVVAMRTPPLEYVQEQQELVVYHTTRPAGEGYIRAARVERLDTLPENRAYALIVKDRDGDGWVDLLLRWEGGERLYHGDGDGFSREKQRK